MDLDPLLLSRLQFVWIVGWHILSPAFTVGLASYIAVLEGIHFVTGREVYSRLSNSWIKIFAVLFGMGVCLRRFRSLRCCWRYGSGVRSITFPRQRRLSAPLDCS